MNINNEASRWLELHSHQLSPEELPTEEEKQKNLFLQPDKREVWPIPYAVPDMGEFIKINSPKTFNEIISDPISWEILLKRQDIYEYWILPMSLKLFVIPWFNKIKWKDNIKRGIPFPLFLKEDRQEASLRGISIENTTAGKSIITEIINKTSYALYKYIEMKFKSGKRRNVENPGGYIISALKNEIIPQRAREFGYEVKSVSFCPMCASGFKGFSAKIPLEKHNKTNSCPKCIYDALHLKDLNEDDLFKRVKQFEEFPITACICINDKCPGKFIPIDMNIDEDLTSVFIKPDIITYNYKIICPYCDSSFTIGEALSKESGFKSKSGWITSFPKMLIWEAPNALDIESEEFIVNKKFSGLNTDLDLQIAFKQFLDILVGELSIKMFEMNKKSLTGLTSWFFYQAVIKWIYKYQLDALRYFFGWSSGERPMTLRESLKYPNKSNKKTTKVIRGQEISIHRSIFHMWLKELENNILDFQKFSIHSLDDFSWFCRKPKFSGGPRSKFISEVKEGRILNMSPIVCFDNKKQIPRMAKIYSIYKINDESHNLINDIEECEWQALKMKDGIFKNGEKVQIEALMLPGHHSHAPIQRILRLRSMVLNDIICRVLKEEIGGSRDFGFWKEWELKVKQIQSLA